MVTAFFLFTNDVGLVILKDERGLTLRKVQDHLSKVAVGPSEPGTSVVALVVDVDALVDQTQA